VDTGRFLGWTSEISQALLGGGSCRGRVAFESDLGKIWVDFFFCACVSLASAAKKVPLGQLEPCGRGDGTVVDRDFRLMIMFGGNGGYRGTACLNYCSSFASMFQLYLQC
jgi:hypothetical protein